VHLYESSRIYIHTTCTLPLVRLSSTDNTEKAEEQPDRVVLIEDLRPFLFSLSQPASLRWVAHLRLPVVDSISLTENTTFARGATPLIDPSLTYFIVAPPSAPMLQHTIRVAPVRWWPGSPTVTCFTFSKVFFGGLLHGIIR